MLQDIVPSKQTLVAVAVLVSLLMALVLPVSLAAAPSAAPPAAPLANDLRISQVYGGGGNSGATYTNDFIEIFNAGAAPINVSGYSVQYASSSGSSWVNLTPLSGTINPGKYLLVSGAAGTSCGGSPCGDPLPVTPDIAGAINLSGTNGKVALVNTTTAQTGTCPTGPQIIDFVGYGTANCFEGSAAAPGLSNSTAALRAGNGCTDTDDNAADFTAGTPTPRNSASPTNACGVDNPPTVTDTTPTDGATNVPVDVAVDVTFSEPVVISGTIGIDCSSSGVQNVTPTGGPSTFDLPHSDFDLGESCTVTIDADQVTDQDGDPNHMAEDYSWSFETTNGCFGGGTTPIHDIQGSGLVSPILGQQVIVEALVNADYQNVSSIRGFFMEEPDGEQDADPATSEGIFIYDNNFGVEVAVGDYVRVSGTVSEFQEQTQLSSITAVTICDNDPVFATPVTVTLPFSETVYPERFEGMSVTLPQTMTVSENFNLGRGGILTLSYGRLQQPTNVVDPGTPANDLQAANNRNQITLDDGNLAQNPDPIIYPPPQLTADNSVRSGDEVTNILGVVTQGTPGWSSAGILYRIYPYEMPTFTDTNPRPPAPDPVRAGSSLRVSSFNVLNYFLTLIDQGPICGPDQNEACRGAYNSSEFTRQRNKLLQALYILDADVLGLMELENTPGVEPLADLVDGLNGLTAPGTYDYIDAGTFIPGDVIKVGIIYKPGVVQPVGDFAILNSLVDPNFNTDLNRPALAQTFEEIGNHGRFTVVVNHLKSKGGCPSDPNDPNADQGDGQACWNLARENAVNAELSWIGTDPTNSGDPDFIIMGDLNAYAMEDPIAALETAGYTNLETAFQGPDAYSYVFFAQAGSLDHSMASPSMVSQVNGATTWHINADEPSVLDYNEEFKSANQLVILYNPDQYRTSDHDPLLIGLNLEPSEADLFVSKIANPDPVTVGETLYYTITTQNVSTPTVATDVVITDVLPAGVSFNGAAAYTGTCNESGGTVVCDMGNIAPDVIESVLISVTVDTAECPGVLSNYVEVASNVYDPNPQNNSQTLETDVECVPPNIEVDPASLASTQLPDTQVIQTLTISNTGGSLLDWMIDEEPLAGPPEAGQPVTRIDSQATVQAELSGEDNSAPTATGPRDLAAAARAQRMLLTTGLLLIPDSTNDRVMAFDPTTGNLVDADFIPADPDNLSTPKSAIFSAGGDSILVSDQIDDVVQEYDLSGNYLGVFAPAGGLNTAILDNITGIALRPNGNLLVTVNSGANQDSVAEFDTSGNYLGNFVANGSGGLDGPFDVYERTGDWLVSSINSDNVLRYDLTGAFIAGLAGINNFPQQVAGAENSNVLIGNFGGTQEGVVELTAAGALVGVYDPSSLGGYRGAYELPNGNILTTNGSGVHEIDRSGNLVQSKITGVSAQYIEYVAPQADCTNLADVPWLSTDPITGTTSAGLGTNVDVTFDSTGLAGGVYNANLCITSNDPDPGPGNGTDLVVVPVTLTVESPPEPPNIDVNPLSLASTQPANMQTNQPLTIANTGGGTLDWTIDEEATTAPPFGNGNTTPDPASASENVGDAPAGAPVAAPEGVATWRAPEAVLWDNGPLVNSPGTGVGGADESVLQSVSLGMNTLGFGHQVLNNNWVADDFTVADAGGWTVDSATFFAYQTGSSTTSTMTGVNWIIYDGDPSAGGTAIFNGSGLSSTGWSNIYRVTETTTGTATDRPIMADVVPLGGIFLPQGTYWIAWQTDGTLGSGPWAPPITVNGQATTGNGLQSLAGTTSFAPALDSGSLTQQGFPFILEGTVGGGVQFCRTPAEADIPWLSLDTTAGSNVGGTNTQVTVTFDSTGLADGVYTGNLCVISNDPDGGPGNGTNLVIVPVTLTVQTPTAVALTDLAAGSADQPIGAITAMVSAFLAAMLTAVFVTARRRRYNR